MASAGGEFDLKNLVDYQQLIDDVESLMASSVGVESEAIENLHARYEKAVRSVNGRLRECDQLLKKGLRNEALERCEVEPKVLDIFLILDFPERDSWEDTVRQCGLVPTELLSGIAAELSDTYATEKPLADLKYQVRLHALARSPLPIRIGLLRKLAREDPGTPLWEQDLQLFEQARHARLAEEVRSAVESRNADTLEKLSQELQSPEWTTPPAKGLIKQVAEALKAIQRQTAREELQSLEPQLLDAYAAFDVSTGRDLRERWQTWGGLAALSKSDPLIASIAPALDWLNEQDRQDREHHEYDEAVNRLTRSLDDGADRSELEQHYHALVALGQGVSEELNQRLVDRLNALDRQRRRRLQAQLACAGTLVLLVAVFVAFTIRNARYRSQLQAQVESLKTMLERKELSEAEAHLAKLDADFSHFAAAPEIQQIKSDVKDLRGRDESRRVQFDELIESAQRDGIDNATMKSIPTAQETLRTAWDLAERGVDKTKSNEEKTKVNDLSSRIDKKLDDLRTAAEDQFNADVTKINTAFSQKKSAPLEHLADLEALKIEAAMIAARDEVSDQSRDTAHRLKSEIDRAINEGQKLQLESSILREMNAAIGDHVRFFAAMDRYVSSPQLAGTARHTDFSRAAKSEASLITGFHEWANFLEDFSRHDPTSLDVSAARKVQHDAEKLMKDHPGFPYTMQIRDCIAYLSKSGERDKGSKSMEDLLTLKMFNVLSVKSTDAKSRDKRYYLPLDTPLKDPNSAFSAKYFTDSEFKSTKSHAFTSIEAESDWRSPQTIFRNHAQPLLRTLKGANWDATFIELLETLYNNSNMDPIPKVQLISRIIKISADGSVFLPKRLERVRIEIEKEKLSPVVNWISPEDAEAKQVRDNADKLLKRLSDPLGDTKRILLESQQALESYKNLKFDLRYTWTGWMRRNSENQWICSFPSNHAPDPKGSDLFALLKSETGQINFVRIGEIHPGKLKLDALPRDLLEGRPVFEKRQ